VARAFVAVVPPRAVLDAVGALPRPEVPRARWSRREQWHVTLQFLGDDADLDGVAGALAGLRGDRVRVRLGGAGGFPSAQRGRVLWLGVCEGSAGLVAVAGAVGERLDAVGYPPDPRPYRPHLTLARFQPPADLRAALAGLGDVVVGPAWVVDEVVLVESGRGSGGRSEYLERGQFGLEA